MGSTKVELVKDLTEKLKQKLPKEQADGIARLAIRAERGYYHDFDSQLAMPKVQLDMDLRALDLSDIADKVRNGDYDDEPPTEEQEQEMLDSIKGTPLEKMFTDMMKKPKKN